MMKVQRIYRRRTKLLYVSSALAYSSHQAPTVNEWKVGERYTWCLWWWVDRNTQKHKHAFFKIYS